MKVCPYCNGVTEESKAIKCSVCGKNISDEPEYTLEELEDDIIRDGIDSLYQKRKRNKKLKKFLIPCCIILILCLIITVIYLLKPSGYIHIEDKRYNISIGEVAEITPIYGGNVSAEDVKIIIDESEYNGKVVSFRWWVEDNKFYIKGEKKDLVKLIFEVKDNGEQSKHNNVIYVSITPSLEE